VAKTKMGWKPTWSMTALARMGVKLTKPSTVPSTQCSWRDPH
jgi:hypothetical protein